MKHEHRMIQVQIPSIMFSEITALLESQIRSERARANAFKSRSDHANASNAVARRDRFAEIRDALQIGYLHRDELDD